MKTTETSTYLIEFEPGDTVVDLYDELVSYDFDHKVSVVGNSLLVSPAGV